MEIDPYYCQQCESEGTRDNPDCPACTLCCLCQRTAATSEIDECATCGVRACCLTMCTGCKGMFCSTHKPRLEHSCGWARSKELRREQEELMACDGGTRPTNVPNLTMRNEARGEMRVLAHLIRLYCHAKHGTPLNMFFEDGTSELFVAFHFHPPPPPEKKQKRLARSRTRRFHPSPNTGGSKTGHTT